MTKLYGAYGSNLNSAQMAYRCPTATFYGTSEIPDKALVFKQSGSGAYLSVEPCPGGWVPLGVWVISEEDEKALDHYEGVPDYYRKETFRLPVVHDGITTEEDVLVYIMTADRPVGTPTTTYLDVCREGYDAFGFDPQTLIDAALAAGVPIQEMIDESLWLTCPRCQKKYTGRPEISRTDNATLICPRCKAKESMEMLGMSPEEIESVMTRLEKAGEFDW